MKKILSPGAILIIRGAAAAVLAMAVALMAGGSDVARASPDTVLAGHDLLETDGENTYQDLVIGADFFGPGSDPFDGRVYLQGDPIPSYTPPGGPTYTGLGPTDTIIERREDAGVPGFPDTIEIEIVALNLVSTAPITVTYDSGPPKQWDVTAVVPENDPNQTPGSMTVRHETADGGTFDSYLPVDPELTFIQVAGPGVVGPAYYSDWTGGPIEFEASDVPWCHYANPLASPPGHMVIQKPGLTTNFFPGVTCEPETTKAFFDMVAKDGEVTVAVHAVEPAEVQAPHHKCYQISDPGPVGVTVTLETQFGFEGKVAVGEALYLCPPAVKNGVFGDLTLPHLKCYDIYGEDPDYIVDLETQFGLEEDVPVGRASLLCVPALKEVMQEPPPEPPVPSAPHYECFAIPNAFPDPAVAVDLQTQFGPETNVLVRESQFLCSPALKNGEGELHWPDLKCYDIFDPDNPHYPDPERFVRLETQFGVEPEFDYMQVGASKLLCVPAVKTVVLGGPNYECYNIGGSALNDTVHIQTQFTDEDVQVYGPATLCAPALKNDEGTQGAPHLECYDIYDESNIDPPHIVDLLTQFGLEEDVEVSKADQLCVPALKTVMPDDPPIGPVPTAPHYACYEIEGHFPGIDVNLLTQFGLEPGVAVDTTYSLCAPALKNGEGDLNAPHLKCYGILGGDDPLHRVNLKNQFFTDVDKAVGQAWELCVPAAKTVVVGVGGIAGFPDVEGPAPGTADSSGGSPFPYAALAGGLAAAVAALAAGGWYARRRWVR